MSSLISWTCDLETDFGGRTDGVEGLDIGLPLILKVFRERKIKGLFFISTEAIKTRLGIIQNILDEGHEIGCHGHFHTCFKEPFRQYQNMELAQTILKNFTNTDHMYWRAPKFSYVFPNQPYSDPKGHVGLLKHSWFGGQIPTDSIFYLHPFDLVETVSKSPNLFCSIWYSNPKLAVERFRQLTRLYPGKARLS